MILWPVLLIRTARMLRSTMGLFPIFMNIIQFWVIDSIIKVGGVGGLSTPSEEPDEAADHEPLFNDHDSDEEEEDGDDVTAAERRLSTMSRRRRRRRRSDCAIPQTPRIRTRLVCPARRRLHQLLSATRMCRLLHSRAAFR
jgi:hypothetical protein